MRQVLQWDWPVGSVQHTPAHGRPPAQGPAAGTPPCPPAGQLRHQELAVPEIGSPPVLLAKGPQVPFSGGAPMSVWAAEQPGFQRHVGRSTFASGRYACEGSLR